jgi:hypothetical protein
MKMLLVIILLVLAGCGKIEQKDKMGSILAYTMEMYYVKGQIAALNDSLIVERSILDGDT